MNTEQLNQIRDFLQSQSGNRSPRSAIAAAIETLGTLPVTADGVYLSPGMTVWATDLHGRWVTHEVMAVTKSSAVIAFHKQRREAEVSELYAMHASALAAREAQ